ncbi:MAG: hypothetical protein AAGA66_06070 [Bacteroidota bacterium]
MQKIHAFNLLLLASLFVLSSCGNDDDATPPNVPNEIVVGTQSFTGTEGLIIDIGSLGTHYQYTIGISDATLNTSSAGGFLFSTTASFVVSFGAASFGPNQFQTGTFSFLSVIDTVPLDNYFFSGTFTNVDTGASSVMEGGTVTISGASPDFTMVFDVTLRNGEKITGAYVGSFQIQ